MSKDFNNIKSWTGSTTKYQKAMLERQKNFSKPKTKKPTTGSKSLMGRIKPHELYALFDSLLNIKPNGLLTSTIKDFPMDYPFWWDFVIESELGYITVIRSSSSLEANYDLTDKAFDVVDFLEKNISKYKKDIQQKLKSYDMHATRINHYMSYKKTNEYLLAEIDKLDLTKPLMPAHLKTTKQSSTKFMEDVQKYHFNSIAFHALGKSLLLNSAFMVESYIKLFISVGAPIELVQQKHLLSLHMHANFETKLRNLEALSQVMTKEVDMKSGEVKNVLDLMTLRNKYVHADESSEHNHIEDVYFDGLFPLMESSDGGRIVDSITQTYHNPSPETVRWAHDVANDFIKYITSLIATDVVDHVNEILEQSPLHQSTRSSKYYVYPAQVTMALMGDS